MDAHAPLDSSAGMQVGPAVGAQTSRAVLPLLAYLGIALAFALPFAVVVPSCSEAQTEPLTGLELVSGANPAFDVEGLSSERESAQELVSAMRLPTAVALAAAVAGTLAALLLLLRGVGGASPLRVLVASGLMLVCCLASLVPLIEDGRLLAGWDLAVLLSIAATLHSVHTARALWPPNAPDTHPRGGRWALMLTAGGWGVLSLAWAASSSSNGDFLCEILVVVGLGTLGAALVCALLSLVLWRPRWSALIAFALNGWMVSGLLLLPAVG